MENQLGAAAPQVQRRVEATKIRFWEEAAPARKFAVLVTCYVMRSFEFWKRGDQGPQDVLAEEHPAGRIPTMFAITDLAPLRSAVACRDALRGMLAVLPQLRWLRLEEHEWDAVVPEDVVPGIVGAALRGDGFTFCLKMKVRCRLIHDELALLMACKQWPASTPPREKECSICVEGLEREFAVELPGCKHAFHRRCISNWFFKAPTCPMCREDVWDSALPEFIEMASTSEPAQGTAAVPDLE
jgi:hypothetical protein